MADHTRLELLGEKTLHQTIDPALISYCPSMDLVALGSTDQQVLIYRLNGQRVYGAAQKINTLQVQQISWKPNGQLLAIAWNDGSVRLVGAESSKVVHQFLAASDGQEISGVTCLGWKSNSIGKNVPRKGSKADTSTWEDLFKDDSTPFDKGSFLNLPRDLSLLDIEPSLPKLSVLPGGGTSDDVFSSRSSLDALFRPFDPKDNDIADVMIVGTKEGDIHVSIYDSFVVGSFSSPVVINKKPAYLISHAANESYSTHALLMKGADPDEKIYLVPMDLRFLSASSEYLSVLASRSTALENLLRYINQIQILMIAEWKTVQDLPGRFLRSINETLAEQGTRTIVEALYHSVTTGHTFPAVKEWLVDILTERGHKRWEKVVVSGLENLRRLVHENMLPALDRCSVILSRLNGIAKFQGSDDSLGFSSHQITLIMDTVASLHLVSTKILLQVIEELDLFTSFSTWIRYEIDRLSSDSLSRSEDAADKEASIDHSKVLLYIQTAMTNSPLSAFITEVAPADFEDECAHAKKDSHLFDKLSRQLEKEEQGQKHRKTLLQVEFLCKYLRGQASAIFSQIAEAEKRNVLFGKPMELGVPQDNVAMDVTMNEVDYYISHAYCAFIPKGSPNQVRIVQAILSIENGISTVLGTNAALLQLGDGNIKSIKFLDRTLSDLDIGKCKLLGLAYENREDAWKTTQSHFKYQPHRNATSICKAVVFDNEEVVANFLQSEFDSNSSFTPEKIAVRSQSGGRMNDNSKRLVVLSKDRLQYKIFNWTDGSPKKTGDEDISMS
ncbi:anaphase-promoting complex component Cut20 Apc4 protein [Rutstroemia sp. NJR-2017a BBW]|nr:anaphase-promoting complex component Cut20 Apc4 protein [Rutstroemia sp. NJR-2017a BBW]